MGDKSPKSTNKQSQQKRDKDSKDQRVKDAAQTAKQVAKPGDTGRNAPAK